MQLKWLLPIVLMALIAPWTPYLDIEFSQYFYQGDGKFTSNAFIIFFYKYGFLPADLTAALAVVVLLLSFFIPPWRRWLAPSLVLILVLAVGSGLTVHAALKDHWGRPRPKQVVEFGGTELFRPFYKPNFTYQETEPHRSFPCGHCSTGFYFFCLAFIGTRMRNRMVFYTGLVLAIGLGTILSVVRIAQGGHFFSDTLISALIMWETALFFDWLIYEKLIDSSIKIKE